MCRGLWGFCCNFKRGLNFLLDLSWLLWQIRGLSQCQAQRWHLTCISLQIRDAPSCCVWILQVLSLTWSAWGVSKPEQQPLQLVIFLLIICWCGPVLKSLLNLLQYCFCLMFWSWGMWDLISQTRDRNCTPCRWSLNCWIVSKVPITGYWLRKGLPRSSNGEGNGTPLQYSCLENPWTEECGGLQSMGSLRVGHDWVTSL